MRLKKYIFTILVIAGSQNLTAQTYNYTYDALNRLTKVQYSNGVTIDYSYDEVGNRLAKAVNGATVTQPDIAPLGAGLSAGTALPGGSLTLSWTENNLGNAATAAAYTVVVALSSDDVYQSGTDVQLTTQTVATAFAAGGSQSFSKTFIIPAGTAAGNWKVLVVSDVGNTITELSETNNQRVLPLVVTANCSGFSVSFPTITAATCGSYNGSVYSSVVGGTTPYAYLWSTGSEAANQVVILAPGTYTVTVTAANGCTTTGSATVPNTPPAVSGFTYTTSVFTAVLTNTSTNATTYSWAFGNGATSTATSPNVTYANAGSYNVCLTVGNASCPTSTLCYQVVILGNGCDVPAGLTATGLTNTTATLSWNASSAATSYNLRVRPAGTSSWTILASTSSLTYTFSNLVVGTPYECQIEAVCPLGNSGFSTSAYFTTGGVLLNNADVFVRRVTGSQAGRFGLSGDQSFIWTKWAGSSGYLEIQKLNAAYAGTDWVKRYEHSAYTFFKDIFIETTGGSLLTGYDNGTFYATNAFLLKLDNSGNKVWSKSYNENAPFASGDRAMRVIRAVDGNIMVAGCNNRGEGSAITYTAARLMKVNYSTGAVIWLRELVENIGPNYLTQAFFTDVCELPDGFFAIGYYNSSPNNVNNTLLYTKFDLAGVPLYSKTVTSPNGITRGIRCQKTSDNKIIAATLEGVGISLSNSYGLISKIDPSTGSVLWTVKVDTVVNEDTFGFELLTNDKIIVYASGHILKLSATGTLEWIKKYTKVSATLPIDYNLRTTNDNKFFLFDSHTMTSSLPRIIKGDEYGNLPPCVLYPNYTTVSSLSLTAVAKTMVTYTSTATVTDISDVMGTIPTITIDDPCPACNTTAIIASLGSSSFCANQQIHLTSVSIGATAYFWHLDSLNSTPVATGPTADLTLSVAGNHIIYLVATNGSCSSNTFVSVTIKELPIFLIATTPEICNGDDGTATVNLSTSNQGASYLWSTSAATSSIIGLTAGAYSVVVTGGNGCSSPVTSTTVTNTSSGMTLLDTVSHVSCYGLNNGSVKLGTINAQAPILYNWSNGASTRTVNNLAPINYSVTVSDAAGCVALRLFTIVQPLPLYVNVSTVDVTSCGNNNGSATANPAGGTPPFTYLWNDGQTTLSAINLIQNNYLATVVDSKGCTARNTGTVGTAANKGDIFFSYPTLSGISNVVLHKGQFALIVGKDPAANFPNYPDTLAQFMKLDLINESGTLYNLETGPVAANPVHSNLTLTPDGKLSMVYEAPTGTMYGFRGMHRIYNCGSSLELDEQIFNNVNWGAWMRHTELPNKTKVISFAHADYSIKYFEKNGSVWTVADISGSGNYLGDIAFTTLVDSTYFSGNFTSANPNYLRYNKLVNLTNYFTNFPTLKPSHNCDLKIIPGSNRAALLYNQGDTLRLVTNVSGNNWQISTVVYQPSVDHRATLYFRSNGTALVAYQSLNKVVVMEKIGSTWSVKYVHNNLLQSDQLGGSRAPSLVMRGNNLWVIYADAQNVYKYNLDAPCNSVQLAVKILLQGPYNPSTSLMNDQLRTAGLIPTTEPYTALGYTRVNAGGESCDTLAFSSCNTPGNNLIVDWILLELRSATNPSTIVATRAGLLQRDGDVVDVDGVSKVLFPNISPGLYYLAVKHRTHLGVRSSVALPINRTSDNFSFIGFQSQAYQNPTITSNAAMKDITIGKFGLWGGNANSNASVRATGPVALNDYSKILAILVTPTNVISNTYSTGDLNMDGTVRAVGPAAINDYSKLLNVIGTPITIITEHQ